MRWCFWKKKKTKKLTPIPTGKRVGLIVGHTEADKGAENYNGQIQEYDYWKEVVKFMDCPVGFRDNGGVKGACEQLGEVDIILELHYNAYNGGAHGCEALYIDSKELAEKFCFFMAKKGQKNRGAKDVYVNGRGIKNMEICSRYAENVILCEMFFGDNKADYIPIQTAREYLEEFIDSL